MLSKGQNLEFCRSCIHLRELFLTELVYRALSLLRFRNFEKFPLVPLGMCKMLARATNTMRHKHEWQTDLLVATEGNQFLLEILEDMSRAMAEKRQMQ